MNNDTTALNNSPKSINDTLTLAISFGAGMIFALGLILAQMVDPNKVVAFLRIFYHWDPSLGLVMGGAIVVATPAFTIAKRKLSKEQSALNGAQIDLPTNTQITPQLIIGSLIFGLGWGLVGFCPAPALVAAFAGYVEALLFLVAMLGGFWLHRFVASLLP